MIRKNRHLFPWILPLLAAVYAGSAVPTVQLHRVGVQGNARQFVTFGYVFAPGDIPAGNSLAAHLASGGAVPIQVDSKATHADGSLRHAVITMEALPSALATETVALSPSQAVTGSVGVPAGDLLASPFDAMVSLDLSGTRYTASAKAGLQAALAGGEPQVWLSGGLLSEWLVSVPFRTSSGAVHPHLSARFAIRAYAGLKSVRVDLTVENAWAYEPSPQGFTYDVDVNIRGKSVYAKPGLKHTHHSRWRKVFWWGEEPGLEARPDKEYWFATGSLPNYDRSVKISESALAQLPQDFEPMSNGNWTEYMPQTGAHDDIGPLPRTTALYVLSLDRRARANVLANGATGGSYPIHYRDKLKDLPVSIDDYPYMTLLGRPGDTHNPATGKSEAFPEVTNGLELYTPDDAHQPSIAFVPYLITGDYFFLEELQFWANWNMVMANPGYRLQKQGLLHWGQIRSQAWSMRTLGQAAYLTPDTHPLKAYFVEKVKNNIDWYTRAFVGNAGVNHLGWLEAGGTFSYKPYGIALWQDDFFTWSIGHLVALGFIEAKALLQWKGKFVVGRLSDPGYCWLDAAAYTLQTGTADGTVIHATFSALFQENFKDRDCAGKLMTGYPDGATGYGANMQPALAAAVDAGVPKALEAWTKYQTREPKQDYTSSPQFAVVPGGPALGGTASLPVARTVGRKRFAAIKLDSRPFGISLQRENGSQGRHYDVRGGLRRHDKPGGE